MAQRLQDQSRRSSHRPPHHHICRLSARGLGRNAVCGSGLRGDRGSWRWRHWSPATRRGARSGIAGPPLASATGWSSRSPDQSARGVRPSDRDLGVTHEGPMCRMVEVAVAAVFRAKYFCCASCSSWVQPPDSRLLSGQDQDPYPKSDPAIGVRALGSFAATCSRQCAPGLQPEDHRPVILPALGRRETKSRRIVALASATPRSSSSRKRWRSVFAAQGRRFWRYRPAGHRETGQVAAPSRAAHH